MRWIGVGLAFLAGAVAVTWPLAAELGQGAPLGTEEVATVPLFNLWTLAWNVESLGRDGYWRAPIFHPVPDTFALSEPQPLTGLLAIVLTSALGVSALVAYNSILLLALAANGMLATGVARVAGLGWTASLTGGALVLLLPFTHQELGVLQLVPLTGILLFALAALRFAERPGLATGCALGLALACAYGVSSQVALFAVLAATPALVCLWWLRLTEPRAWLGLLAGAALCLSLIAPVLLAQTRVSAAHGFERSLETVREQSARPAHYWTSAWPSLLPVPQGAEEPSQRAFWPGSLRMALAAAALALAWSTRWRRLAVACALLLATSLVLSMAGHLALGEASLASLLRQLPGLSQIRSYFRFALFAQLAVAGLVAVSIQTLTRRALTARETGPRRLGAPAVLAVATLAVVEMVPAMGPIEPLPPLDLELPWLEWILESTEPDDVLAFVPFPEGRSSSAYLGTSQWMYWQMRHWRPMVNGYSGFFPARFRALKSAMRSFPSTEALQALDAAGVRYCVVHRNVVESSPPPDPDGPIRLVPLVQDERHALAIFELTSSL